MDPKDDPEARIRELERPLAEAARTSELGAGSSTSFPPPPPGPPAPWPGYAPLPAPRRSAGSAPWLILFGAASMFLVAGGIATYLMFSQTGAGNPDTFSDSQSTTVRQTVVSRLPMPEPIEPSQVPAGQTVIVSGISENRTIECQDHTVIVSGMQNRLEITGHCAAVTVSGIENAIVVESVDTIGVSGFQNRVTFHTGQPEVANSGQSNVVEQG